jgi:hypothetical protein
MLAISDDLWKAAIAGLVTVFGGIFTVLLALIHKTGEKSHRLLNSGSLAQLKISADLSDFKASITKAPEDIAAAKAAHVLYEQHQKQADDANFNGR